MFATKALAILRVVNGCFMGMKWAYLDKRSMTTIIAEHPFNGCNPSMKSIEISVIPDPK